MCVFVCDCVCVLTGNIEIDQPLIFAHFVFSRAHIHDRNADVAYLKPAHYLLGEKRRMSSAHIEEGCCHGVEPTVKTHISATDSNQSLRVWASVSVIGMISSYSSSFCVVQMCDPHACNWTCLYSALTGSLQRKTALNISTVEIAPNWQI